ncbi:LOW QUALITY PROTEIN: flowering time control protein FPA-like [Actinidia eriantha]|uniref:LOW QUALITY PROTEIN: flowering time control protein FPA-like n=1 Tax=Actinidia eriantha TaxID=165200 RepID=UPI00258804E1|nr:LOW QUALITY PROTEIN: flowering time control protein FPA-like [Actinidia eriantha]
MTSRGGRDRYRRDYPQRSEEKSHHSRNNAPPSRHLWVGNLSHNLAERTLANHFLQFGELESIAFQPGRSYAFVNFKNDEDAFVAVRALQGFVVGGNALKIEFAKADKSSTPSRDEDYLQYRDEQRSAVRGSPFSQRDSRTYHSSPDHSYPDKSKMSDKSADQPSEVLWIGFPSLLKVDEVILRKAFSPFGEIEKITVFPGRSYAFVRFKNVMASCRAKETLQGKLFGNPRVHICFARGETGPSNSGRNSMNAPPSPNFKSYGRARSSENFRQDRNSGSIFGDPPLRSPRFISNLESGDPDVMNFGRKGNLWTDMGGAFEQRRFQEPVPDLEPPENMYKRHRSPPRNRDTHFRDFSPPPFPRKGPFYDNSWDLPEDASLFQGNKKLRNDPFPPENELPEYPFSGSDQAKHVFPSMFPDCPQPEALDKKEPGPFGYKQPTDRAMNLTQPYGERSDQWNASYDSFHGGSGSLPPNPVELKRSTPESRQPSLSKEWKWEGTIAKGGTPICSARCFPVGKVLDMALPEFLDCTARTGLDMLAKHYYQAASSWVVFFVPESDADIGFYNEFMHYLGEKQRAAVAKLDENTTLFLVPPSEFSEKVLKVPGKLSISGVVLRLEHPGPNSGPSLHHAHDRKEANFMSYHGDMSRPKPTSPSGPFPPAPFPNMGNSGIGNISYPGNLSTGPSTASFSNNQNRNDILHQRNQSFGPNWSPPHLHNPNSGARNMTSQSSNAAVDPSVQGYNPVMPRNLQETSSSSYNTRMSNIPFSGSSKLSHQETKPRQVSSSMPTAGLQPEQLAQLASSLLGQPRQSGAGSTLSMGEDFRHSNTLSHSENSYGTPEKYVLQNNQFDQAQQVQPQQQLSNVSTGSQREFQTAPQGNQQQMQSGGTQEEDADPQKRLQATLQLAAALLQQIQQGKGN